MGIRIEYTTGERIPNTRLRYIEDTTRTNPKRRRAKFLCDCGDETTADLNYVRFLTIISCGCYKSELITAKNTKHSNAVRGDQSGAYRSWVAMHQRVKVNPLYSNISVCDRWYGEEGFKNFLNDMGDRPPKHSIERKNNLGDYEPSNCKWATQQEQANNTRTNVKVELDGEIHTISEWCRMKGISYKLVKDRRKNGMSLNDALTAPLDETRRNIKRVNKSSVYTGVRKRSDKWEAYIYYKRKNIYIGRFETEIEAVKERDSYIRSNNLPVNLNF